MTPSGKKYLTVTQPSRYDLKYTLDKWLKIMGFAMYHSQPRFISPRPWLCHTWFLLLCLLNYKYFRWINLASVRVLFKVRCLSTKIGLPSKHVLPLVHEVEHRPVYKFRLVKIKNGFVFK